MAKIDVQEKILKEEQEIKEAEKRIIREEKKIKESEEKVISALNKAGPDLKNLSYLKLLFAKKISKRRFIFGLLIV